jgi:hypothetical protein
MHEGCRYEGRGGERYAANWDACLVWRWLKGISGDLCEIRRVCVTREYCGRLTVCARGMSLEDEWDWRIIRRAKSDG